MKAKVTFFITCLLLLVQSAQAQWSFHINFKEAEQLALQENKLMLIYFRTLLCCSDYDQYLWRDEELADLNSKVVPIMVRTDLNPEIGIKFGVSEVPTVVLTDISGEFIWRRTDIKPLNNLDIAFIKSTPLAPEGFSERVKRYEDDKNNYELASRLGHDYQNMATSIDLMKLKMEFVFKSSSFFKKARKADDPSLAEEAELNLLLNDALVGREKKVVKKLEKEEWSKNEQTSNMVQFVTAICYKNLGDAKKYEEAQASITDEELKQKLKAIVKDL